MSVYNNHLLGANPFEWWIGQVVDESNWVGNINPKLHDRDDVPGWGNRYKVRIFGRDSQTKDTPDDRLEMAEIVLPVTAGSGHGGSVQSPNIRQGCYVYGFYKDGIDRREPIIFGVMPNNSQTRLFGGDPNLGFIPRSGYYGKTGTKPTSTKNIYSAGPNSITQIDSCPAGHAEKCVRDIDQYEDGNRCHYIPKTKECDGSKGEIKGIQKFIKNALKLINEIKSKAKGFLGAASDLTASISQIVNDVSLAISGLVKSLISRVRGYIISKINNGIKDLIAKLPPNIRAIIQDKNNKAVGILQCVFNKIIKGLFKLIKSLLEKIIDKYINAPLCAIEKFIGDLLSSILGEITKGIQSALDLINGFIGKVGDIVNKVFEVLDFVAGILSFLTCEEKLDCGMQDEWSFWGGAKCALENVSAGIKSTTDRIKKWAEDNIGPEGPPCDTAQIPCGPPIISITGGGGSGAFGNPIISATGAILGIDFKSGGAGYVAPPNINIVDSCGIGGGAIAIPILLASPTTSETNIGNITINEDSVEATDGEVIIENGETTINPDGSVSSSDGTVTFKSGSTVVTNTGGNTTSNGGNILINGGTTTEVDGVKTISGGIITITGGSVSTNGGLNNTSSSSPLSGTGTGGAGTGTGGAGTGTGRTTGGLGVVQGDIENGASIIGAVIVDPGSGYLQSPDGSTGGNGSVFSNPDQTIVFNNDKGYNVYSPNDTVNVSNGDLIYTPPGTTTEVYDNDGNVSQTIIGKGGTTPIEVNTNGTITAPTYDPNENILTNALDPSSKDSYPVVLSIGDVAILNGGVNYNPTDKIIIKPDNGAELEPIFNNVGRLIDVNVINPGIGFTDFPKLFIESEDGLNAVIVPVFSVLRVGDLPEDQDIVPPGTQIINVVDCVGKVS